MRVCMTDHFFNVRGMIFLFKCVLRIKERLAESKMK